MSGPTPRRRERPKPAMNVTPLVDVVLVLLIIFMVVLPQMEHAAAVELPEITNVDEEPEGRSDPITVSVGADRTLHLEDAVVTREELVQHLQSLHRAAPLRRVILRGDTTLRYAAVRDVFELCRSLGFPGVSLRVGERAEAAHDEASHGI